MSDRAAPPLRFGPATAADAAAVAALVRGAYASTTTWTSEARLVDHERIDAAGVAAKIADPAITLLVARDAAGRIVACATLTRRPDAAPEFGLFAVEPELQAAGLGRQMLAEAERVTREELGAASLVLRVFAARTELIAWYGRRGYAPTGRTIPFSAVKPGDHSGLAFVELAKRLDEQQLDDEQPPSRPAGS